MVKSKFIYSDLVNLIADYHHPQSDEFVHYEGKIIIKDIGKEPVIIELFFVEGYISFAPEPPIKHRIKAKNIIDLNLKLIRWFNKYGYILKEAN